MKEAASCTMEDAEFSHGWQQIAQRVQEDRDASVARIEPPIPEPIGLTDYNALEITRSVLSTREVELTEKPPEELLTLLRTGKVTSVEVTKAFLRRSGLAQKLVNCITELLPERALTRAQQLDDDLKTLGKPVGALHGLPISVKEHISMKHLEVNEGFVSGVGNVQEDDADIIKALWQAGAVFYVRTTEPQTLMHLETSSNLYGVTVNPHNRTLSAGGSSGGEGALIALRGSCLGIGTDIGGSIRGPAANNGIYGFKPTSRRLSLKGIEPGGFDTLLGCVGPLSTSFNGIKCLMEAVLNTKPWMRDPSLIPIPWRSDAHFSSISRERPLKIGVLWEDEIVKPHPPIRRALRETVEKLRRADNIECVDWKPYQHDQAWKVINPLYFPDGGQLERTAINSSGEPWRPLSHFIVSENPHITNLSFSELVEAGNRREAYRNEYNEHWNSTAIGLDENGDLTGMVDVILGPVGPGTALPFDSARYWEYTCQWNLLDYPALVFPVSKVEEEVDLPDLDYKPRNERDKYNYDLYDGPSRYKNAPISLQLIGRRYEDEKVLQAFEIISRALNQ